MHNKLYFLEGLRGLAALIVVFCHLKNTFFIHWPEELLFLLKDKTNSYFISHIIHSIVNILFDGGLAVYIFWFMSAYVISIKLFTSNDDSYLIKSFIKRYFRLLIPVLASVLFAYIVLSSDLMYNSILAHKQGKGYIDGWLNNFYNFEPNFFLAIKSGIWDTFFDYDPQKTYNAVLWSIKPELFGSIFCYFIFGIFKESSRRYVFYVPIILGTFALEEYWLTSFMLGFLFCDIDHSDSSVFRDYLNIITSNQVLNIFLFICLIIIGGKPSFFGFDNLLISSFMVLIILKTEPLQRLFESNVLIWLGKISFALYLIHLPIICSLSCYLFLILPYSFFLKLFAVIIVTLIISLIGANLFTKYIDNFGIKVSRNIAFQFLKETTKQNSNTNRIPY